MKKSLIFLLIITILLSFSACTKSQEEEDKGNGVDIKYYAELGQMPECEFSLHSDVEKVENELSQKASEDEEFYYNTVIGNKSALIELSDKDYYYLKDKKEDGILYIVNFNGGYGFSADTVSIEIKNALSKYPCTEETANLDAPYARGLSQDSSILKYVFGKNTVIFVFNENTLSAVAVFDSENWNLN